MSLDLKKAKSVLMEGGYTCVMVKGEVVDTSMERGIRPLFQIVNSRTDREGYSAADKVVGKAAAYMYVLMKVREVFAQVISVPALEVLEGAGIEVSYGECVSAIRNRMDTGFCPMESAVMDVKVPEEAYLVLEKKLEEMRTKG